MDADNNGVSTWRPRCLRFHLNYGGVTLILNVSAIDLCPNHRFNAPAINDDVAI